jgi:hypothetical protein
VSGALSRRRSPDHARRATSRTWTADNGNGTFSNPLFYDEFSDPDLIRVGDEFYHDGHDHARDAGLPVLRSRDLVNWELDELRARRLDLGPEYRLEGGKEIYGKGIWAPSFRHHGARSTSSATSTGRRRSTSPRPTRAVRGHARHEAVAPRPLGAVRRRRQGVGRLGLPGHAPRAARQHAHRRRPGNRARLFAKDAGMGEGAHFYKIDGKYYITSAWYAGRMRLAARARIVSTVRGR